MKTRLILLLIAAAVLVAAAPPNVTTTGRVTRVIPRADLLRGRFGGLLKDNAEVVENDRIQTQSMGRARVVLNDGSILNVGSDSCLTIRGSSESSRAGSLELRYGRIRAAVVSQTSASQFQVRTATAVAGVLGTDIYVEIDGQATHIVNISAEGSRSQVRVVNIDRRVRGEVVLDPGQGTMVMPGEPPIPPHSMGGVVVSGFLALTDVPQ